MPFPVEERFVFEAEQELGARFPSSYRSDIMLNNGGEIHTDDIWFLYPILNKKDNKMISRTAGHLVRETTINRKKTGFPENAVSIGHDGAGNRLIFQIGADGMMQPEVYRWDHKTKNTLKLVTDFEEFPED